MRRSAKNGWGRTPQPTTKVQLYILSTLCRKCESAQSDRKYSSKNDLAKTARSFFAAEGGN